MSARDAVRPFSTDISSTGTTTLKRRRILKITAAAAIGKFAIGRATADETIKIGLVVPLAGAFAASGQDELHGAQLAVADINAAGGIRSIGGRRIELLVGDAGGSPETAVTTTRRILNGQPVAAIGCWYSSLTLAATEVAEQKKIPWMTSSGTDSVVSRGFKYIYQNSAGSAAQAQGLVDTIAKAGSGAKAGSDDMRLSLLMDNNAVEVDVVAFLKKHLNAPIISNQTWAPPLSDATPAVSATMHANPTVICVGATSTTDQALVLKQLAAQGNKALVVMAASSSANATFLNAVGAAAMEGLLVVTPGAFPGNGAAAVDRKFAEATKIAFMDCEALAGYTNVHILAQGLEKAGNADPAALQEAMKSLDARDVPAIALLPGGSRLSFRPDGRRVGAAVELLQWQNGRPRVLSPPDVANGELIRKT